MRGPLRNRPRCPLRKRRQLSLPHNSELNRRAIEFKRPLALLSHISELLPEAVASLAKREIEISEQVGLRGRAYFRDVIGFAVLKV